MGNPSVYQDSRVLKQALKAAGVRIITLYPLSVDGKLTWIVEGNPRDEDLVVGIGVALGYGEIRYVRKGVPW